MTTSKDGHENVPEHQRPPPRRGFAGLAPERRKEIARLGGRAAHATGQAHEFTPEEARNAQAKGLRRRAGGVAVDASE